MRLGGPHSQPRRFGKGKSASAGIRPRIVQPLCYNSAVVTWAFSLCVYDHCIDMVLSCSCSYCSDTNLCTSAQEWGESNSNPSYWFASVTLGEPRFRTCSLDTQRGWHTSKLWTLVSPFHRFESLKRKLYNCNASIYFNRQCLKRKLTTTYAKIKIPNTSPACKHTQHKVTIMRIKDEIKYLHTKKQKWDLNITTRFRHII